MAREFLPVDRDQQWLLPPSIDEWLPPDHQARFVVDAVESMDLSVFVARHRLGGVGRRAYDPAMMVALLLWAYTNGVFSSREIERRCVTDLGFRFVAGNHRPDHGTIARFRAGREEELKSLHAQVVGLCQRLGLVQLGVVALDGTKVAANASKDSNRGGGWLDEEIGRWFEQAAVCDAAEDDRFGDLRGDEIPEGLVDRSERLRRLREARDQVRAIEAARQTRPASATKPDNDASSSGESSSGESNSGGGGGKGGKGGDRVLRPPTANVTDPDSRLMRVRGGGFVQGYNAQAVATPAGVVLAASVTTDANDLAQFEPMVRATVEALKDADVAGRVGVVLADAGYWSLANSKAAVDVDEVLIATDRSPTKTAAAVAEGLHEPAPVPDGRHQQRVNVIGRWVAGDIDHRQAAQELGLSIPRVYELRAAYRHGGEKALIPQCRPAGTAPPPPPPSDAQRAKHAMRTALTSDAGRALYKQRAPTIEGVFGNTKHNRGFRRFSRRGLTAVTAEWALVHVAGNLTKAHQGLNALLALLAGHPPRARTT